MPDCAGLGLEAVDCVVDTIGARGRDRLFVWVFDEEDGMTQGVKVIKEVPGS
jgi:hypothetical protein